MILPILAFGHPTLKKVAEDITPDYPNIEGLIADMFETMNIAGGVGLAAPQIGKSIRVLVVNLDAFKEKYPQYEGFSKAYLNLRIVAEEGKEWDYDEGCLSIPTLREYVTRKPIITVEYDDVNFVHHTETLDGMLARVLQHEHDHLEGSVYTEKLSSLRRTVLAKKLRQISEGKIRGDYKMIYPNK